MNILISDAAYLTMSCLLKILGDLKYTFVSISVKENFRAPFLYLLKNFTQSAKESNRYSSAFESQTRTTLYKWLTLSVAGSCRIADRFSKGLFSFFELTYKVPYLMYLCLGRQTKQNISRDF